MYTAAHTAIIIATPKPTPHVALNVRAFCPQFLGVSVASQ